MTTKPTRRKYALTYSFCRSWGLNRAVQGTTRDALIKELQEQGYREAGITHRRVLRAYDEQVARG